MSTKKLNKSIESLDENQLNYKKIGNRIRQLRIKAGYSSAEKFAYEYEISRTQYARYELGADMRISSLLKIAAAYNMTLHEFFKGVL
jgi:transcriptional regulator with XRE-family HTH domain